MALTKNARNKIQSLVQQCKKLLVEEVENQMQQYFGIRPDGSVSDIESLTSNDPTIIHKAELLRQRLDYLQSNIPDAKTKAQESFAQLVREQAFTILNRMASLRMAEERDIIRESIRQNYNSEGFLVFDDLTGQGKTTELYKRYTWYIFAIFDELAQDLPAVFDRYSPYAIIFPGEDTLLKLLEIINDEDITIFREEGQQAINLWKEDETIGWIYQYYNSREEIKAMRDASNAPRNSRELAVRNQFFTPRYVVQFLTDNSLGRIWYEMTKGKTDLADFCEYLVKQPNEVFLEEGEQKPADSDENSTYIEHRHFKDPREIFMIDPACGSMHFGLYAFDLYEKIYLECWDKYQDLIRPIIDEYECGTREEYASLVPGLIIRHNIHGVDIDPRAVQIAGLSLWLRAQKSYQRLQLDPKDRPSITKANIVCAEPMPGDKKMFQEFLQQIDQPLRPLVTKIWEQMALAGETGLLLKIEEELKTAIQETKKDWEAYQDKITRMGKDLGVQADLFEDVSKLELREKKALYQNISEDFFDQAEGLVLKALQQYAESASNGSAYQKHLFAEDTARGFAFIDLCRKRYDVLLMNPPFGSASDNTIKLFRKDYRYYCGNILCAFIERAFSLINDKGEIGVIHDRVVNINSSYKDFRKNIVCGKIQFLIDTGWGVLDANVETTAMVLSNAMIEKGIFIDVLESDSKGIDIKEKAQRLDGNIEGVFVIDSYSFTKLPNSIYGYFWDNYSLKMFNDFDTINQKGLTARQGHALAAVEHFRLFWELLNYSKYKHLYNGSKHSMFYLPYRDLVIFGEEGYYVRSHRSLRWSSAKYQLKSGLAYGRRGEILDVQVLKQETIFTSVGLAIPDISNEDAITLSGYLNSILGQFSINLFSLQHKQAGYLNLLPYPNLSNDQLKQVNDLVVKAIKIKRKWFSKDETALEYRNFLSDFVTYDSIRKSILTLKEKIKTDSEDYFSIVKSNDNLWLEAVNISISDKATFEDYKKKRPKETLWFNPVSLDEWETESSHIYEIIQALFGVVFGRWDIHLILNPSKIPAFDDFFAPLPFMPELILKEVQEDYPIEIPENGILVDDGNSHNDVFKTLRNCIRIFWKDKADKIEEELCEIGQFESLEDFVRNDNGFFNYHFERYTKSRRISPIYWALTTPSNSFTVWLYYPKLNDQTLFKVVNDFVNPKLDQVQKQINLLDQSLNANSKLNDFKGFKLELEEFKAEILSVAQLPYKPNHNDGVLITASPLHNLFQHTKWHKATEDCWKKLEAGEYDWSHMAYSIWTDRVREKCKKDLSLAIAHGLEDICEIKPKEKKSRKKKETPKVNQLKIE